MALQLSIKDVEAAQPCANKVLKAKDNIEVLASNMGSIANNLDALTATMGINEQLVDYLRSAQTEVQKAIEPMEEIYRNLSNCVQSAEQFTEIQNQNLLGKV